MQNRPTRFSRPQVAMASLARRRRYPVLTAAVLLLLTLWLVLAFRAYAMAPLRGSAIQSIPDPEKRALSAFTSAGCER